jgi:GNAT superfamily N-acetyltransferase
MADIVLQALHGPQMEAYLPDLARLRVEIFRDFPYLYDGSLESEAGTLAGYGATPNALIVVALDGTQVVGVATGKPLVNESDAVQRLFLAHGMDPATVFYFGESVLQHGYRGRGIGVRFFQAREEYAHSLPGITHAAFCAVQRPPDHPRRPPDYVPLDDFWRKRGYTLQPHLQTEFTWRDLDETTASPKPMAFWLKALAP